MAIHFSAALHSGRLVARRNAHPVAMFYDSNVVVDWRNVRLFLETLAIVVINFMHNELRTS